MKSLKLLSSENVSHQLGALVFTALTLIGATELVHEQQLVAIPVVSHAAYINTSDENVFARAEGKNEAARMPEEYDVGLKATTVSGV